VVKNSQKVANLGSGPERRIRKYHRAGAEITPSQSRRFPERCIGETKRSSMPSDFGDLPRTGICSLVCPLGVPGELRCDHSTRDVEVLDIPVQSAQLLTEVHHASTVIIRRTFPCSREMMPVRTWQWPNKESSRRENRNMRFPLPRLGVVRLFSRCSVLSAQRSWPSQRRHTWPS
jgi:hypothetical protein